MIITYHWWIKKPIMNSVNIWVIWYNENEEHIIKTDYYIIDYNYRMIVLQNELVALPP
jgi:hypothetical protein